MPHLKGKKKNVSFSFCSLLEWFKANPRHLFFHFGFTLCASPLKGGFLSLHNCMPVSFLTKLHFRFIYELACLHTVRIVLKCLFKLFTSWLSQIKVRILPCCCFLAAKGSLKCWLCCVCVVRVCAYARACARSCLTLCYPMTYSLPGSSVQARILEWVAISFSRGSSQPRDWTHISPAFLHCGWILYCWTTWEAYILC